MPSRVRLIATKCLTHGISMSKATRAKLHHAINALTGTQVASIVRKEFPKAKGGKIDQLAKAVIANAHRIVSPRKTPRG
jgi:hypothetical protein